MKRQRFLIVLSLSALALVGTIGRQSLLAGNEHGGHGPYAEFKHRAVKAMSQKEIDDLKAGNGMGFALPAELNGYPGPVHMLDFSEPLELTPAQRKTTERIHSFMRVEAIRLGHEVISAEAALEQLFRDKTATIERIERHTSEIARIRGRLRAVHLSAHLEMRGILTEHQIERYSQKRGYR